MKSFVFILLTLLVVGCSGVQVVMTGSKLEPINHEKVNVYPAIPRNAAGIAFIRAKSPLHTQGAIDQCLENLKRSAAKLGANGIHINQIEQPVLFFNGFPILDTYVTADAFHVLNEREINTSSGIASPSFTSKATIVDTENNAPPPLGAVTPNAYGPGVGMDATGRPVTVQPAYPNQGGYYGDSVIQKPNAFGPGIGMDQYGRPVQYR
jgi:hypothetical protein